MVMKLIYIIREAKREQTKTEEKDKTKGSRLHTNMNKSRWRRRRNTLKRTRTEEGKRKKEHEKDEAKTQTLAFLALDRAFAGTFPRPVHLGPVLVDAPAVARASVTLAFLVLAVVRALRHVRAHQRSSTCQR